MPIGRAAINRIYRNDVSGGCPQGIGDRSPEMLCYNVRPAFSAKNPGWEAKPFADDLATLPLDLLMANQEYSRSDINFFLLSE
jgi:hypothetical protein